MAKEKEKPKDTSNLFDYNEESIKSLDWKEHIRLRPGMYIGKLGDGSSPDDGIYVLAKEVLDNCIDEYTMGYGKTVEITVEGKQVTIRDYGRGIPLGKVVDVVSKINTGAKYDSKVFQKSVGLNGVGTKAVNAGNNSLPDDLEKILHKKKKALENFQAFPQGYRKRFLFWIDSAKTPGTRAARIKQTFLMAVANKKPGLKGFKM